MVGRKNCCKLSVWGCVLVIVALTLGCSSKRERGPEFLDSESELDPDAEAERLRQLQMLRVWVQEEGQAGEWQEWEHGDLQFQNMCREKFPGICDSFCSTTDGVTDWPQAGPPGGGDKCTCAQRACSTLMSLCVAQTRVELAAIPRSFARNVAR